MTVEYSNRKDERYTLYEGRTKTGKPKYFCSRKPSKSGIPVLAMPEGYEWRENPSNGIVSVRRITKSGIMPPEKEILEAGIRTHAGLSAFVVDIDGENLIAYISDFKDDGYIAELSNRPRESLAMRTAIDRLSKLANYSPMLRFTLEDTNKRLFSVERWCFRGAIDDWIFVDRPAPLAKQIKKYVRHLGQESFFELI